MQKGQGVVEYGLILGFVAVIGVYLVSQSGMKDAVQSNVGNAKQVLNDMNTAYTDAANTTSSPPPVDQSENDDDEAG